MSAEKEFDEMIAEQSILNKKAILSGQKIMAEALLREIDIYDYKSTSEIKGALHNHLDRIKEKESEKR